jgi:hypothetical protein
VQSARHWLILGALVGKVDWRPTEVGWEKELRKLAVLERRAIFAV